MLQIERTPVGRGSLGISSNSLVEGEQYHCFTIEVNAPKWLLIRQSSHGPTCPSAWYADAKAWRLNSTLPKRVKMSFRRAPEPSVGSYISKSSDQVPPCEMDRRPEPPLAVTTDL